MANILCVILCVMGGVLIGIISLLSFLRFKIVLIETSLNIKLTDNGPFVWGNLHWLNQWQQITETYQKELFLAIQEGHTCQLNLEEVAQEKAVCHGDLEEAKKDHDACQTNLNDTMEMSQTCKQGLETAIARTAMVNAQVQSFTEKISINTESAIGKFFVLLQNINSSIKESATVVDTIRNKMAACVVQGEKTAVQDDLTQLKKRYESMLQEIITQFNLTIESKKEDITKLDHIRESASRVKPFSHQISDIASATNLIALNALIEASRAGEHGRTFKVVANEIRALSHRATASSKEMDESLTEIVDYIEHAISELKGAIDVESSFINATVILLQDLVMSVLDSFISLSDVIHKTLGDSSNFRDEVNGIVINLQFEDICNQMSQHTVHILDTMQQDLETLTQSGTVLDDLSENGAQNIREKLINDAKALFTMEEERVIARSALDGVTSEDALPGNGKGDENKNQTGLEEADILFFDELPPSSELNENNEAEVKEDGLTINDTDIDGDDDVTFFDDAPSDEVNEKQKKTDDIAFDDEDDVTFF